MLCYIPCHHTTPHVISLATIPSLMLCYIPCHHTIPHVLLYPLPLYRPSCFVISLATIPSLVFCNIPCYHTTPHVLLYRLPPYRPSCFVISLATILPPISTCPSVHVNRQQGVNRCGVYCGDTPAPCADTGMRAAVATWSLPLWYGRVASTFA